MTAIHRTYHSAEYWLRQYMSCGRKIQFVSESEAQAWADRAWRLYGSRQRPYPCGWCNGWHNETVKDD